MSQADLIVDAMLRASSEAHAGQTWTDDEWARIRTEFRATDLRVLAMQAAAGVALERVAKVAEAMRKRHGDPAGSDYARGAWEQSIRIEQALGGLIP